MRISINTILNCKSFEIETIITSKQVNNHFPTLWIDEEFETYEIIYEEIYYDTNIKNRYEKGQMLSIDQKHRINAITTIYAEDSINLFKYKILATKDIDVEIVRP